MGMLSFMKEAGQKWFGDHAKDAEPGNARAHASESKETPARAIAAYIAGQNLQYTYVAVAYDSASSTVTVKGIAPDQATKEKILRYCGHVQSINSVVDEITVEKSEAESKHRTEASGGTLSGISKVGYGDPNKYCLRATHTTGKHPSSAPGRCTAIRVFISPGADLSCGNSSSRDAGVTRR